MPWETPVFPNPPFGGAELEGAAKTPSYLDSMAEIDKRVSHAPRPIPAGTATSGTVGRTLVAEASAASLLLASRFAATLLASASQPGRLMALCLFVQLMAVLQTGSLARARSTSVTTSTVVLTQFPRSRSAATPFVVVGLCPLTARLLKALRTHSWVTSLVAAISPTCVMMAPR